MKIFYLIILLSITSTCFLNAQTICDPNGNLIIYSNYDGGDLTIDIDQNIPNLYIGVCSYEFTRVTITGAFANNVVGVWYAGFQASNDHCNIGAPLNSTITGGLGNIDSIMTNPAVTLTGAGLPNTISYAYECSSTPSSGNSPEQLVHFFKNMGVSTLRYHKTQYGCWTGNQLMSATGNCCLEPITTDVVKGNIIKAINLFPNPTNGIINISNVKDIVEYRIMDLSGRVVVLEKFPKTQVNIEDLENGVYFFQAKTTNGWSKLNKIQVIK